MKGNTRSKTSPITLIDRRRGSDDPEDKFNF